MRLLLVLLLLGGCSTIDKSQRPADDFPQMTPVIRYVGFVEMQRTCRMPLLASAFVQCLGHAELDFCTKTCRVTLLTDAAREHELDHCRGYDHPGDDAVRAGWSAYKVMDGPRFCRLKMGDENYFRLWPEHRKAMP